MEKTPLQSRGTGIVFSVPKVCPLCDPPVQIVEVPFEGTKLPGYFWRPDESDTKRPTLFVAGGKFKILLNTEWSAWFNDLNIVHLGTTTMVYGNIDDVSELFGLLDKVRNLGLEPVYLKYEQTGSLTLKEKWMEFNLCLTMERRIIMKSWVCNFNCGIERKQLNSSVFFRLFQKYQVDVEWIPQTLN